MTQTPRLDFSKKTAHINGLLVKVVNVFFVTSISLQSFFTRGVNQPKIKD